MIIYRSQYFSIEAEPEKRLLSATWFKASIDLNKEEVKAEISKILDYAIIVESKIKTTLDNLDDLAEEGLVVEYFTDPEKARQWITS